MAQESDHAEVNRQSLQRDIWLPLLYTVKEKKTENRGIVTLTLAPSAEEAIEPMEPGQFNMLYAFGIGEIPISISSLWNLQSTLVHTIQDVGAVSKAFCDLSTGDQVGVRGPYGTRWPLNKAKNKDVIILAGGVGMVPLRPLIERILNDRSRYGKLNVLFGARSPENIIFHQDIISWQADPTLNFQITVDHAYSNWRGHVGVVTYLIEEANFDPENTIAFICGPEIMMRYAVHACLDANVPTDHIFLSIERNMKCATGFCGHCQYGPFFVCKDGAVFSYPQVKIYLNIAEL
ncbi:MAG: FAD/NAD(P)-binding protein [Cyclobacteriaceae bacterium]|nr:FAD/NAD(P)-binding protein [Cyclobacteriaceae bacterium]